MYNFLTQISQIISEPVTTFLNAYNHSPLVMAFLLGLIGATAPCQLTGNISAITLYGNRAIQTKNNWMVITSFIVGKIVVYSVIGLLAWSLGNSFESKITDYFPLFRKAMGPLLVLTGLVLLGVIKLAFLDQLTGHSIKNYNRGILSSFLLGASFAIAFCPTMFVLFFVWLLPTVISTSYGFILPSIFGFATSIPLLIILGLLWYFDVRGLIMKKSRKVGKVIQRVAGVLVIIIGILDAMTYW